MQGLACLPIIHLSGSLNKVRMLTLLLSLLVSVKFRLSYSLCTMYFVLGEVVDEYYAIVGGVSCYKSKQILS